ncbi:DUF2508 family protein [Anaerosalibacter massiliensis]|uniref:YaaL family protein n=1 Tax=Anaerosalibacter massiliensis TaxID=1347392 RepID=A0A9X2S579_9FIRM|nr:DUF2508 family protein [Anaerosalibacter massiliensis]MCR2044263.1 YaaL family protein [Anaerosalibacter massiliensis]
MDEKKENYREKANKIMESVKVMSDRLKESTGKKALTEEQEIVNNIKEAFKEWKSKERYFESVTDPDLIDHAIYEIEACKIKYIYFLKQAKKKGIKSKKYL